MTPLLCHWLGHRRSRRDARCIDNRWISYCRRCGSLMIRDAPQCWTAVRFVDGIASNHDQARID
jgi:hypothetical protein